MKAARYRCKNGCATYLWHSVFVREKNLRVWGKNIVRRTRTRIKIQVCSHMIKREVFGCLPNW